MKKRIGFGMIVGLGLMALSQTAMAEQNRARLLSENSLSNTLMDLRMAREDLRRSRHFFPIPMFNYERSEGDLSIMITELEQFLFPRVKIKTEAVPVRLNGRYFKEALEEGNVITPLPEDTGKRELLNINDLIVPASPDMLTDKDIEHLNDVVRKDTVVVVNQRKEKETIIKEPVEVIKEVIKEVVKEVEVDSDDKAPSSVEGVIYAWQKNFNDKNLENMMKLYSEQFRGNPREFDKRRTDFDREFKAYPDARINTYNINASRASGSENFIVDFDAQLGGRQWQEFSRAVFTLNGDLKIIDEEWTEAVPVIPDEK